MIHNEKYYDLDLICFYLNFPLRICKWFGMRGCKKKEKWNMSTSLPLKISYEIKTCCNETFIDMKN